MDARATCRPAGSCVRKDFCSMEKGQNKVIVVLVDGMRPDGMMATGHPFLETIKSRFSYSLNAQTVDPSVTLPCHMSLFHSVDPSRHGVTTNTYVPQVRPITGLAEAVNDAGLQATFFYTWEELRDLGRPDSLAYSLLINQHKFEDTDTSITAAALDYIRAREPDFTFLYLGETDEVGGHNVGWMSETYEKSVYKALTCIEKVFNEMPEGYSLIILADHGGHDRSHGSTMPEDMTIPVCAFGPAFREGYEFERAVSIKDVAPTVTKLLGVRAPREWEGTPLV